MSEQDLLDGYRQRIIEHGFTMVAVGGAPAWTYTIGLVDGFGQPEFVTTGLAPESVSGLFTQLVARVRDGERFDASSPVTTVGGVPVRFGVVHPEQWTHGRFNMWLNYYGELGVFPNPAAVQVFWPNEQLVFPPDPAFCRQHPDCQPSLDIAPTADVNWQPNRAERRRRRRR